MLPEIRKLPARILTILSPSRSTLTTSLPLRASAICSRNLSRYIDPAVAANQVFFGMQRDGTLANLRLIVAGVALMLLGGQFRPQLAIINRPGIARRRHILGQLTDVKLPRTDVVDRKRPAHPARLAPTIAHSQCRIRHTHYRWQANLNYTPHGLALGHLANLNRDCAVLGGFPLDVGPNRHQIVKLHVAKSAVENKHVPRVHGVFMDLQPIAGITGGIRADERAVGDQLFVLSQRFQDIVARQHRLALQRPQVRKYQPVTLLNGIPGLAIVRDLTYASLAGLLQTTSPSIEQPAMVAAADAALFDFAVEQTGSAMRAAGINQPISCLWSSKQNQVFAQNAHGQRQICYLLGGRNRMPVPPQHFAARGASADFHQFGVVRRLGQVISRAVP